MSIIYVRSTTGVDTNNGSTWALAKATLAGAAAIAVAGDTVYVSHAHAETNTGDKTINFAGTVASPIKIICANDGAQPPTALATTATWLTNFTLNLGGSLYVYGISFTAGSGGNQITLNSVARHKQLHEMCNFMHGSGSNNLVLAGGNESITALLNCGLKLTNSAGRLTTSASTMVEVRGGSMLAGGTSPVNLLNIGTDYAQGTTLTFDGFDLSNLSASVNLMGNTAEGTAKITFRDCVLPASWTGSLFSSTPSTRFAYRGELFNTDSANTNYRLWLEDHTGSVKHETTVLLSGGASDGTTALSWKIATSALASYPLSSRASPEMVIWNDTVGAAKTVTVEVVHDSQGAGAGAAFNNDEIWLEVLYLGSTTSTLGTVINNRAAWLDAPAVQTSSSATWTTTGLTTPVKQKLSLTFTPQKKGFFGARVMLAKASKTVYVDPKITVA